MKLSIIITGLDRVKEKFFPVAGRGAGSSKFKVVDNERG